MTSAIAARNDVRGRQEPRIHSVPPSASSYGREAVELASMAGLVLDPWEELVLVEALGEREDGRWAAFEVGVEVARQNGKGAILEARELAGLFLLDEGLIIHSAHQFDTSLEAFRRLLTLIEGNADLSKRVKRVSRSHGEEGIELYGPDPRRKTGGQRIRFRTRTKGGGRGFTGDCLVLDEAMDISESFHGALLPTLSARSIVGNPQVWYTGSAVDQVFHENGLVFARLRQRGIARNDPALAYFGWSPDCDHPNDVTPEMALDPEVWAQANPGLGIRISAEHIEREQRSMDARTFAVERLGVGDWPDPDQEGEEILEGWGERAVGPRENAKMLDPVCFGVDAPPDRSSTAIVAAGKLSDGRALVEVVARKRGTGWVVERLKELQEQWAPLPIRIDGMSPVASLLPELEAEDVEVEVLNTGEFVKACGMFYDAFDQDKLRHLDEAELNAAAKGAATRPLSGAWAWDRKGGVDISPLVAATIAHWGLQVSEELEPMVAWVSR